MPSGYDQSSRDREYEQAYKEWMADPSVREQVGALGLGLTRAKVEKQGWSRVDVEGGRDAAELSQASYMPDYAALIDHDIVPDSLPSDLLIRGLLVVREDTRPQLSLDCIIHGLRHPFYKAVNMTLIAEWNSVTKPTVSTRVRQSVEKLGLTIEIIEELELRYSTMESSESPLRRASEVLVRALLYIGDHDEPKKTIDCMLMAVGHKASDGVSLQTVARRFGVTKADIHKLIKKVRSRLNLPRARFNKSPAASAQYVKFNKNTKRIGDVANGSPIESPCNPSRLVQCT